MPDHIGLEVRQENTIRISGKKVVNYPQGSVHRRKRVFGEFDRTLSLPVQLDPDGIKAAAARPSR